jgi:hypothetical protein
MLLQRSQTCGESGSLSRVLLMVIPEVLFVIAGKVTDRVITMCLLEEPGIEGAHRVRLLGRGVHGCLARDAGCIPIVTRSESL